MFTRSESYYIKKRKKLRKKIREFEKNTQWPNKAKAKKLWKMKARYEALGRKWWDVHKVVLFEDAEFGLDITDLPISLTDIRLSAWSQDPHTKRQKVEGSSEWKALRVLEDKSRKMEIWNTPWLTEKGTEATLTIAVPDGNIEESLQPFNWLTEEEKQILIERYESRND